MLLTVAAAPAADRRAAPRRLHAAGGDRGAVARRARARAIAGCALGLVLGDELSIHLFHANPGYPLLGVRASAPQRAVGWQSVAIAVGGGMLAAIVAVLSPLRDILSRDPLAAITPQESAGGAQRRAAARARRAALRRRRERRPARAPRSGDRRDGHADRARCCSLLPLALDARCSRSSRCSRRQLTSAVPHIAVDGAARRRARGRSRSRRPARSRCSARRDPGRARRPAAGPRKRRARRERLHRHLGLAGGRLQPAADRAVRAHRAGEARSAARACARCASIAAGCSTGASGASG